MSTPEFREPLARLADNVRRAMGRALHERVVAAGFDDHRETYNNIFAYLYEPEGTRITTLADRAGITKQSMSELVHDAVERGYAELVRDPTDGRAKLVRFGRKAHGVRTVVGAFFVEVDRTLDERYGPRKVKELRRMLTEIAEEYGGTSRSP